MARARRARAERARASCARTVFVVFRRVDISLVSGFIRAMRRTKVPYPVGDVTRDGRSRPRIRVRTSVAWHWIGSVDRRADRRESRARASARRRRARRGVRRVVVVVGASRDARVGGARRARPARRRRATDATRARARATRPPTGRRDDGSTRGARARATDGASTAVRGILKRGGGDARRREARRADDAATATAPIATATGTAMTWMRARADPMRWVMFPGRALEGGAPSYDWRGAPFAGDVADPIDASVTYRRTLVALEIRERRAHTSCGGSSAVGDGRTSDGMTTCALRIMRTKGATNGDDRCAGEYFVVYVHGNACDVGDCAMEATKIAVGLKAHVIVPEFPGYGVTEGVAHEESVNAVVKATVKYCVKYLNVSQSRMIIMGRSIGTGPACWITRMMCAQGGAGLRVWCSRARTRPFATSRARTSARRRLTCSPIGGITGRTSRKWSVRCW